MFGNLYIVATPIGNLEDITLRAISILKDIDVVLAEDTRVTKKLLDFLSTNYKLPVKEVLGYHQHSSEGRKLEILKLLIEGKNLALVTDAGTPGISDPGNELVDFLLEKEPSLKLIPIPGPSSITTALSICGFDVKNFEFLGFFPKKKRTKVVEKIKEGKKAYVFFESPRRLIKTFEELLASLGEKRRVFVARELTKMYEETYRGTLKSVLERLKLSDPRGEVVVVVEKSVPTRNRTWI